MASTEPTTNRASRKFETKGRATKLEPPRIPLRRSLPDSLLVLSANPLEFRRTATSSTKKKICTCTAQTSPSPDRLGSVRGDRLPVPGRGREKLHALGGTNPSTKAAAHPRIYSDVPGAATRAEAAATVTDWWPRPPRSMHAHATSPPPVSPRTSRRNLSRRAPNHHQNPPRPPPCSGTLDLVGLVVGSQHHHREALLWVVALCQLRRNRHTQIEGGEKELRRAVARGPGLPGIKRDDANVRRRGNHRRLSRVRLKMRAPFRPRIRAHGHHHCTRENDLEKKTRKNK